MNLVSTKRDKSESSRRQAHKHKVVAQGKAPSEDCDTSGAIAPKQSNQRVRIGVVKGPPPGLCARLLFKKKKKKKIQRPFDLV